LEYFFLNINSFHGMDEIYCSETGPPSLDIFDMTCENKPIHSRFDASMCHLQQPAEQITFA
jgi:hypothetical protein